MEKGDKRLPGIACGTGGVETCLSVPQRGLPAPVPLKTCITTNPFTMKSNHSRRFAWPLFLILFTFCLPSLAQKHCIKGLVADSASREALPYVSVSIQTDSTVSAISLTDASGVFALPFDSVGTFRLHINYVGYKPYDKPLRILPSDTALNLGRILLSAETQSVNLKSAEVIGRASSLTINKDTFTYSSKAMILDPGVTLSAMISQMPGVKMDKDGNLTWMGKKVESILIGGKKFFGGDIKTALQNLPAEMIANLKLYDKKSDDTERTGIDDGQRTTVIDVGIKKEYQGSWTATLNAGAGHESKWMGRAFLSRFSPRLRTSFSTNNNNLNGDMRVDENGNWYVSGFKLGWSTINTASFNLAWDSQDDKRSKGYKEINANLSYDRSDIDQRENIWQENFLPGQEHVWWIQRSKSDYLTQNLNGSFSYSMNIDSLTQATVNLFATNENDRKDATQVSATMNSNPEEFGVSNVIDMISTSSLPENVKQEMVNTMDKRSLSRTKNRDYGGSFQMRHRFAGTMNQLGFSLNTKFTRSRGNADYNYYDGHIYSSGVDVPDFDRQYSPRPTRSNGMGVSVYYNHQIMKQMWWNINYMFNYTRKSDDRFYYLTNALPGWDDLGQHPLGEIPQIGSGVSLPLDENSTEIVDYNRANTIGTTLSGTIGKWETGMQVLWGLNKRSYEYNRVGGPDTIANKTFSSPSTFARLKYKFTDRTSLSAYYNGSTRTPDMYDLIDATDTSDPQMVRYGNPNLKSSWSNNVSLQFNTFREPRQAAIWAYVGWTGTNRNSARIMNYNPETGYYHYKPVNIDGQWSTLAMTGVNFKLDKKKEWTLDFTASANYGETPAYVGIEGGEQQINTISRTIASANLSLSFRRNKFAFRAHGNINPQWNRNSVQKESDEDNLSFSYDVNMSYTTPWGMGFGSDFTVWSRRGFRSQDMNNDQYIWNANITQTLFKDKSLTLKLEGVDMLDSRRAETMGYSAYANYIYRYNSFKRYFLFSVIYRFGFGKKKAATASVGNVDYAN